MEKTFLQKLIEKHHISRVPVVIDELMSSIETYEYNLLGEVDHEIAALKGDLHTIYEKLAKIRANHVKKYGNKDSDNNGALLGMLRGPTKTLAETVGVVVPAGLPADAVIPVPTAPTTEGPASS